MTMLLLKDNLQYFRTYYFSRPFLLENFLQTLVIDNKFYCGTRLLSYAGGHLINWTLSNYDADAAEGNVLPLCSGSACMLQFGRSRSEVKPNEFPVNLRNYHA